LGNCVENDPFAHSPVTKNLSEAEPDDDVAKRSKLRIAPAVILERILARVELPAVDLNHNSGARHNHVNATYPGNRNLLFDRDSASR
jgi:hypothetical protein